MGLLKKNTMLVGGMLLLGLGTANAEMSVKSYVQKTDDSVAIEQLKDFESRYESMIKTVESLPEEKIAEILSDTGKTILLYAEDYPDQNAKEELQYIGNQYIEMSKKDPKSKMLKFLKSGANNIGIGAFKGVSFLGDVSNILYNVVGFPTLILKDIFKIVVMNKTTKESLLDGGKMHPSVVSLFASTLINWGFPPKVADEDYKNQFNPTNLTMVVAKQGFKAVGKQVIKEVINTAEDPFWEGTWDEFVSTPIDQLKKTDRVLSLVTASSANIALGIGVMQSLSETACAVQGARPKDIEDRNRAGTVLQRLCDRMRRQNLFFEKPAAGVALFIGKPIHNLIHHKKKKKSSVEAGEVTGI